MIFACGQHRKLDESARGNASRRDALVELQRDCLLMIGSSGAKWKDGPICERIYHAVPADLKRRARADALPADKLATSRATGEGKVYMV